jgi:hypothetical protein
MIAAIRSAGIVAPGSLDLLALPERKGAKATRSANMPSLDFSNYIGASGPRI